MLGPALCLLVALVLVECSHHLIQRTLAEMKSNLNQKLETLSCSYNLLWVQLELPQPAFNSFQLHFTGCKKPPPSF